MSHPTAIGSPVEALGLPSESSRVGSLRDFVELTKPRLTSLVSLTVIVGFHAGSGAGLDLARLTAAVAGTTLLAAGGCALNMVMERDLDARMERTRNRPLPAGRLGVAESTLFGSLLGAIGLTLLAAGTNWLTFALGVLALVSYLGAYTPLKTHTGLCTLVGAVPGALPPAMGWTAATGSFDTGGLALFGILFLWQLPHFLSIAWMRRDDYARGGFPMLTVVDPGGGLASRQMILYCVALIPASLLPTRLGLAGTAYFACALVLGVGFLAAAAALAWQRTDTAARRLFLTSLAYLPLLLLALMLDKTLVP